MTGKIKFYLFFLILLSSGCYELNSAKLSVEDSKRADSQTSKTVLSFFTPSANPELTDSLVRPYPDSFSECLLMTQEECISMRRKKQNSIRDYSNRTEVISIKDSEISILVKNYQDKIKSNQITLNQIKSEWTIENESRVRVELTIEEKKIIKDLLLFRGNQWQIFEVANENEYPNFVQPSESNKVF